MTKNKQKDKKKLLEALKSGDIGLIDDPDEEREILEAFEKEELVPVKNGEEKKRELIEAAWNTKLKTKRISIRLPVGDLERLREKSAAVGIPYQTVIGSLIHQYANDRLIVRI